MSFIPQHHAIQLSDFGIMLKTAVPDVVVHPVDYPHQDDYYCFGLIEEGTCKISIDFEEHEYHQGNIVVIQPGQVHHYLSVGNAKSYVLMVDNTYIHDNDKQIFEEYVLNHSIIICDENSLCELKHLFQILKTRMQQEDVEAHKGIIKNLSLAIVSIMAHHARVCQKSKEEYHRYMKITLHFRKLIKKENHLYHSASYYAELLHLSPAYLNEAIKSITGFNTSQNIQNEVTLRAKRMLVYTSQSIQEIADTLGFEDYAYFSRYFTKAVGISPSLFRRKYLE